MSAQESAEACADYVQEIYESPVEILQPKHGDAEEWRVTPEGLGIRVSVTSELLPLVHNRLKDRRIAHYIADGTIFVSLP